MPSPFILEVKVTQGAEHKWNPESYPYVRGVWPVDSPMKIQKTSVNMYPC